jgi:hypothetical protein
MNTEVYIEGYRLDITTEISALLNFAIDDIKDFSSRSTTWSRTIVLPGTANNNRLFGHIFQVGQSNNYDSGQPNVGYNFNAAKSAPCIVFQDQIQAFKGVLRLLQMNISNGFQGRVEYEVSVFGSLVGLNSALSGALLEDLDFSAYDHIYNDANIVASWDNPGGSGYYYPLIDYGTYSTNKHDWDIRTFRPALYMREYIDKIFQASGYKWSSALFDTPRFKSIVIPHSQKQLTVTTSQLVSAKITNNQTFGFPPAGGHLQTYDTVTGTGFSFDAAKAIYTYLGTLTTNVNLSFTFEGTLTGVAFFPTISLEIWKNGTTGTLVYTTSTFFSPFTIAANVVVSVAPGDTIEFRWFGTADSMTLTKAEFSVTSPSGVPVPIAIGNTVTLTEYIPKNIRQIDFLVGIVKLWNLYVYEDKFDERLIYITPYIDFYSHNTANSVDWTYKLNRNKVTTVKPMSELNAKIYKFQFKSDSDYYNDLYKKRYNEGYGDRIYDSEFEFAEQTKSFEIIFSATPLVGYGGEDKVYSTILKQTGNPPSADNPTARVTEENVDSNIRILQTKKVTGVTPWNLKNGSADDSPVLNTLTRYGYAGHLDDPDIPTNDLNFGAPKELFFILTAGNLSNNQFNVYWSGYMREITDKDSKLVTANFYLTTRDILNLDFSKYVYVDGIAYRLNAIKDYDLSKPNDCVVELLKVNATAYTESASNSGPPEGCYLLWSDENTLDADDDDALLYGDCATNPGDGDTGGGGGGDTPPDPPTTFYVNWTFNKSQPSGSMIIFRNDVPIVSTTANGDSGSFVVNVGEEIKALVGASFNKTKSLFVANDVDGVMFNSSSSGFTAMTYTFVAVANKNYNVQGSVT